MSLRIVQVDAFTATPFAGNPAAVCVLPEPREDRWMQEVAREMNLAETAFLTRQADGFNLRWHLDHHRQQVEDIKACPGFPTDGPAGTHP